MCEFTLRVQRHKRVDDGWAELTAGPRLDLKDRFGERAPVSVRAVVDHCVEAICDARDGGRLRNEETGQTVWIAAAVPPLMVRPSDTHSQFKASVRAEELAPPDSVGLHQCPLAVGERCRTCEHVIGHSDLADVVEYRGETNLFRRVLVVP